MITVSVDRSITKDNDIIVNNENDFPIAYVGRGTYTGNVLMHTYQQFSVQEEVHLIYIGRYTSVGDNIRVYCDINHDYRSVYMGVIPEFAERSEDASIRERIGQVTKRMKHKGMILIGNDVWIGNDVTLISDVIIGNGAVIGAGSVVAKDIPPYTIWCGNPAVCIGNRFSSEIISGFQKISWWDWDKDRLKKNEADMKDEPEAFVAKNLDSATDATDSAPVPRPDNDLPDMIAFLDTDSLFPTYGDTIEQFINQYSDNSANLIIYYDKNKEKDVMTTESLSGIMSALEGKRNIYTVGIAREEEETVIRQASALILGRDIRNISRISYAMKYNVKCISGVNKPIFQ